MEMVNYRIVEGSTSEIEIDSKTGNLTYIGPQMSQSKNYTLKVLAIAGTSTDLCSVQILVAGLGSSPPVFLSDLDVMKINIDSNSFLV